jgi:hypothetical protein
MKPPYIVSSGCSFTSNGIGGFPPSNTHPTGGCSFVNLNGYNVATPSSWASILAKKMQCTSFVNLAASSHGNILVSMSLIEVLNRFSAYRPDNSLVVFNLTDPGRLDVPCSHGHHDKSGSIPWNNDILPFSFLSTGSKTNTNVRKTIGIEQVEIMSQQAVLALLNFLEHRKFKYRFVMMQNYLNHNGMYNVLKDYQHNLVTLPGISMEQYCIINNLTISKNDTHPNQQGHTAIAEIVYNTL